MRSEKKLRNSMRIADLSKKVALAGVSTLLALFLCEIIVRYAAPQNLYRFPRGLFVSSASLQYKLTPNFQGITKTAEYATSIRTNSLGLREDREYGKKAAGAYRILAIGDSFTMGMGVELKDTFVKILEALLKSDDDRFEYQVINSGVAGYNTRQAAAYLRDAGLELEPDLVLLNFYVGNDIQDNCYEPSLTVVDGYLQNPRPERGLLPVYLRQYLSRNSHLYELLWSYQRRLFDRSFESRERERQARHLSVYRLQTDENSELMWNATLKELNILSDLAKTHSVRLAVAVIPEHLQTDPGRWRKVVGENRLEYGSDKPSIKIAGFCKRLGIPMLDLLSQFAASGAPGAKYLELDGHWNTEGNRLAAESIYRFLREEDLIPQHPAAERAMTTRAY